MTASRLWVPPTADLHKKAAPPTTGPKFGNWAGRDISFATLPGGGVLQFDLSRLTLADYRGMRDHYQINASLSVLSFMMHQLDWHIECADKTIANAIEENIRTVWTRLVRGMAQAFWAGYSPMTLEYENNVQSGMVELARIKDLVPEECSVHWKKVEGWSPPGTTVPPKLKIYDGFKQWGQPGPFPVENCVHPDTKILCEDLVWRRAGDLNVGQRIIAFDEEPLPRGRRYRTAEIVVNNRGVKDSVRITADGRTIEASIDHPFLVRGVEPRTGKMSWIWRDAKDLAPGDQIAYLGDPASWDYDDSREAGWIAGMFDGEAYVSSKGLSISQNPGPVLDQLKSLLAEKGFQFVANENKRDRCVQLVMIGGVREVARFLAVFRPIRLIEKFDNIMDGVFIKNNKSVDVATVTSVDDIGQQPIASIQTSCGTFITGGFLSHNTLWYPLLMENGDYYGRKLLKPAFQPWFFSMLIHLFANRYYERFGEPLPIGRADYDTEVEVDGVQTDGRTAMNNLLTSLRNRSVVTLPSERDGNDNYLFDIEYLESQMRGADWERYMSRLDEEMSLGLFTPVLLFRTADVGSYNLGVSHMQVFLWMLNSLAGDMKEYIDRYIIARLKSYNFNQSAPKAEWVPRKMGKENVETMRAVLTELVRSDKAKVDLDELGQAVGLTLSEIRTLTEDDDDDDDESDVDDRDRSERTRKRSGPRGTDEPRATTRKIAARISDQVARAMRKKTFGSGSFRPTLGYRSAFEAALVENGLAVVDAEKATSDFYKRVTNWMDDALSMGAESWDNEREFAAALKAVMDGELQRIG